MNFKKGDIVKVVKEDSFMGIIYPVGSIWEVECGEYVGGIITVYDSRSEDGVSILYADRVTKIERVKPRFKLGDMVRVKLSTYNNDNSIGKIYKVENIKTNSLGDEGIVYLRTGVNNNHNHLWPYRFREIELVDVNKNYQYELEELKQAYELLKNTNKKLEEDLLKAKKRATKFFEKACKRFDTIQGLYRKMDYLREEKECLKEENKSLKEENQHLNERDNTIKGMESHIEALKNENASLKTSYISRKSLRKFLTGRKG